MNRRRSWLIAPAHDPVAVEGCMRSDADVAVLDLEYTVPPKHKEAARARLKNVVQNLGTPRQAIFVRIGRETRWADARAAVVRGVQGIVFPGAEEASEVADIDGFITGLEKERGVESGTTEIVLMLESARGFWNAGALAQASSRISTLGVGRADLTMQLGPVPQDEFRLYRYLMTRTLVAARTFGKSALGAHWRPGSRGGAADAGHTARAAREAGLMGFDGCLCVHADQVAAVNSSFSNG